MNNENNQNAAVFCSSEALSRLAKSSRKTLELAAELGYIRYTVLPSQAASYVEWYFSSSKSNGGT